jgi:hypothetical protein
MEFFGMDSEIAAQLMKCALHSSGKFNEMAEIAAQISDEVERTSVRRSVADMMGLLYTSVMLPIIKQYPGLDPDRD